MHGALLAVVHPDNTPHGANLTFAFPVVIFVIVAGGLYLRFRAAHNVPGHVPLGSSRWVGAGKTGGTGTVNLGDATMRAPASTERAAAAEGTAVVGEPAGGASVDEADEQVRLADEGTEES